ncbi:MAG TPA: hypothetical protein VHA33_17060 [Candidatus Angelobacter sp.]|jgi:DNA-directed RNA polymerase specialized sigma24 family protein|nr:hypothetical protein [Candidatus Angelobacter sp.]
MKNKWTLTPDAFNRLLAWLSPSRAEAGCKYEEIRQKLITYFTRRGHPEPEDLADETIDRAARKLESGTMNYSGDPVRDLTGFARYVWQEDVRRLRPEPIDDPELLPAPDLPDREALFRCLDQCMANLTGHSRDLLVRYHQENGHEKIVIRQLLADEAGITLATLRIRVCRMVRPVRECFFACIQKENAN